MKTFLTFLVAVLNVCVSGNYFYEFEGFSEKYNIYKVTSFIRTLLADLGETYKRSSVGQLKVVISSVFTNGVAWNYNGTLNYTISPLYQTIRTFSGNTAPSGAGEGDRTPYVHFGKVTFYR